MIVDVLEIMNRCHVLRHWGDDAILCDFESLNETQLVEDYGWTLEIDSKEFEESEFYQALKGEEK